MESPKKVWLAVAFMAVAAFSVSPAWAGRWELRYTPNAAISVKMVGDRIVGIVNPTFGPGRAGELELRLAGVPFVKLTAPPYEFGIDPTRPVAPLPGEEYRGFGAVTLREGLDYTIEAYVMEKGNRKQSASPALTFRLEKKAEGEAAPGTAAAPTPTGLDEEQLKKLLKEAYETGCRDGRASVTVSSPVPGETTGTAIALVRDEAGHLLDGVKVKFLYQGGEKILETCGGKAIAEVPPGQVSVQLATIPGYNWVLSPGSLATVTLAAGQQVVWEIERKEVRR